MFVLVKVQVEYVVNNVDLSRQQRNFVSFSLLIIVFCLPTKPDLFCSEISLQRRKHCKLKHIVYWLEKKEEKRILISVACKISCHVPWNVSLFRTGFSDVSKNNLQNILSALNPLWLVKKISCQFHFSPFGNLPSSLLWLAREGCTSLQWIPF